MSAIRYVAIAAFLASTTLAGCASNPGNKALAGTWQGRAEDQRPFSFGSVTFAQDGTYTAEARYGDTTRVQSGNFEVTEEGVILDESRTYDLTFEAEAVIFTDPVTGNTMTLDRFR